MNIDPKIINKSTEINRMLMNPINMMRPLQHKPGTIFDPDENEWKAKLRAFTPRLMDIKVERLPQTTSNDSSQLLPNAQQRLPTFNSDNERFTSRSVPSFFHSIPPQQLPYRPLMSKTFYMPPCTKPNHLPNQDVTNFSEKQQQNKYNPSLATTAEQQSRPPPQQTGKKYYVDNFSTFSNNEQENKYKSISATSTKQDDEEEEEEENHNKSSSSKKLNNNRRKNKRVSFEDTTNIQENTITAASNHHDAERIQHGSPCPSYGFLQSNFHPDYRFEQPVGSLFPIPVDYNQINNFGMTVRGRGPSINQFNPRSNKTRPSSGNISVAGRPTTFFHEGYIPNINRLQISQLPMPAFGYSNGVGPALFDPQRFSYRTPSLHPQSAPVLYNPPAYSSVPRPVLMNSSLSSVNSNNTNTTNIIRNIYPKKKKNRNKQGKQILDSSASNTVETPVASSSGTTNTSTLTKPEQSNLSEKRSITILRKPSTDETNLKEQNDKNSNTNSLDSQSLSPPPSPPKSPSPQSSSVPTTLQQNSSSPLLEYISPSVQNVDNSLIPPYTSLFTTIDKSSPTTTNSQEILNMLHSGNCVQALSEYCQRNNLTLKYDIVTPIGPSHSPSFSCGLLLNERRFNSPVQAQTKKDAQRIACHYTLQTLYQEAYAYEQQQSMYSNHLHTITSSVTKHDIIAQCSLKTYNQVVQSLSVNNDLIGRKTISCILLTKDDNFQQIQVLSIGTGNCSLLETNYVDDGTVIHDCHAEILARRGFIKFLIHQLQIAGDDVEKSIFELNTLNNKFQLKDSYQFHLFISSLPCGDASMKTKENNQNGANHDEENIEDDEYSEMDNIGLLRYKQEQSEGTCAALTPTKNKYHIKSCSDKICRWNILGLQGGLLVNLICEPIYLSTITIACPFDQEHVKKSLIKRLDSYLRSKISQLTSPYKVNQPEIDCPKIQYERQASRLQSTSFAWNISDSRSTELIEPTTGRLRHNRGVSKLSKKCLFQDFNDLLKFSYPKLILDKTFSTYEQAKHSNDKYVMLKNIVSNAFESETGGVSWISKSERIMNAIVRTLRCVTKLNRIVQIPVRTTIVVERMHPLPKLKSYEDIYDYNKYSFEHFQYRIINDTDANKWGNIDVILTEYVEGVGYKGEIVNIPRQIAYTELLPSRLALYPTEENIKLFEEERKLLVDRPQISPFVKKCRDYLKTILLQIPINMKQKSWILTKQQIRVALRRMNIMCSEEAIQFEEGSITNETYKLGEDFNVNLKINETVDVDIKCILVPVEKAKLWDEYAIHKRKKTL
ncbi:unnamed protein product [Didymodactylos carnosus]|uniref:A to I editase domain-containing protein n=1 Tax=Didymodactylos carnosus TaxID=1234261 RepID=A0A8S2E5K5_9BILA|nr:unnamed protein product [Didymodactylos carnosus]CAF3838417.1 unnamed protein product [Didymodactylos carnosus]